MDESEVIDVIRDAIMLNIKLSAPTMLIGLFVGVSIALVQALFFLLPMMSVSLIGP
jgi:flagellar biosynthesis protein FliQ